jgi:hypothetical protein
LCTSPYVKKVVGVFVRFRAPLQLGSLVEIFGSVFVEITFKMEHTTACLGL